MISFLSMSIPSYVCNIIIILSSGNNEDGRMMLNQTFTIGNIFFHTMYFGFELMLMIIVF
jgi:hypothetical protein